EEKEWDPEQVDLTLNRDEIKFDDFMKVEMRVAEIMAVEAIEESNKLLKFRLDAGDKDGHRQILSGIRKFYPNYEELVGKKVSIVSNLKPRKMVREISQGMILSAEDDEGNLTLIEVSPEVQNGAVLG